MTSGISGPFEPASDIKQKITKQHKIEEIKQLKKQTVYRKSELTKTKIEIETMIKKKMQLEVEN